MGIGVLEPATGQKGPSLNHPVHHRAIGRSELARLLAFGFQNLEPSKERHMGIVGAVGIDRFGNLAVAVGQPDLIVVLAMPRSRMDKAGTGIIGDMITGQHRHRKAVTFVERGQRMGHHHALAVSRLQALPRGDLGGQGHIGGQLIGNDEPFTGLGPGLKGQTGLHGLDLIEAIGDLWIIADRAIGRDGPRGRRPDHHIRAKQGLVTLFDRETDPDGGRDMVVIFDLGVGQSRALHRAPHDRL